MFGRERISGSHYLTISRSLPSGFLILRRISLSLGIFSERQFLNR